MTAAADEHHLPGWPSPDGLIMHNADAVTSDAEFLRLLREILAGSGRTAGKVAAYSGSVLPRSTAYRFVSPSNRRLPQYQEQVEAFLSGCGCHPATADRLVEVWRRLSTGAIPAVHDLLVPGHVGEAEPAGDAGLPHGAELEPHPMGVLRTLPSFTTRQDIPTLPDLADQDGRVVVHGDLNIGIEPEEPDSNSTEFSICVFRLVEIKLKSRGNHDLVRRALLFFLILMVVFAVVCGGIIATVVIAIR